MENITINIKGKSAGAQASSIIKAIYKIMAKMEDGGSHVQIVTSHIEEGAAITGQIEAPEFMVRCGRRRAAGGR